MMFDSILCACIGNICRSPVAEAVFKDMLQYRGHTVRVESAGTHAMVGEGAQPFSLEVANKNGLDISAHRARQITKEMLHEFDIVIVMDDEIRKEIVRQYPFSAGKVKLLGHFSNKQIRDPYRRPKEIFQVMYADISHCAKQWIDHFWK